jgi:hypothetical protein
MNPDGSDLEQIGSTTPMTQPSSVYDENGSFSPDGRSIVFSRSFLDETDSVVLGEVWVMGADGSNPRRLADGMEPHWLPDGRVGYRGRQDGTVSIVTLAGQRTTLLPGFPGYNLAWSPLGGWIAYAQGTGVHLMRDDGSNQQRITDGDTPEWSPDGSRLLFTCSAGGNMNLCTIRTDGTARTPLTASVWPERNSAPKYAPDGRRILFARTVTANEGWGPYTMNADGSDPRPLPVPLGWRTQSYSWQPVEPTPTPTPTPSPSPTAVPSPEPSATPAAAPAPTPAATPPPPAAARTVVRSRLLSVPFSGAYRIGRLPRSQACKGRVSLELRRGKKLLDRAATRLDRRCRYAVTFSVGRTRVGKARTLTVIARFHGNARLGATTNRFVVAVPKQR